jgi:hypothetical protein
LRQFSDFTPVRADFSKHARICRLSVLVFDNQRGLVGIQNGVEVNIFVVCNEIRKRRDQLQCSLEWKKTYQAIEKGALHHKMA